VAERLQDRPPQETIGRNVRLFGIGQVAIRFFGTISIVVLARLLTTADFGRYTVAVAVASLLTLVVELGMGGYIVREATQDPDRAGVVMGHVLTLQAVLGAVALALSVVVSTLLGYDGETFVSVLLLGGAYVLNIASASCNALLTALDRVRDVAIWQSANAFGMAVATLVAALVGGSPMWIGVGVFLATLLSFPAAYVRMRRRWHGRVRFEYDGIGRTLRSGAAYSAARLGQVLLIYLSAVLVEAHLGNEAAGFWGAAHRLLLALLIPPLVYGDAVTRSVAHLAKHDRDELGRLYARVVGHLVILGLPIAVGGSLLAEPIMRLLFGEPYVPAAGISALLLLGLVFHYPAIMFSTTALGTGRERLVALTFGSSVVINVALNLLLLPRWGTEGAAMAMLGSQAWLAAGLGLTNLRQRLPLPPAARMAKAVVATALMAAALLVLRDAPLPLAVLAGALVYAAALLALRALEPEDVARLPRRLRRVVVPRPA
jgi:O-antigen/teichoic acid export membrane protein